MLNKSVKSIFLINFGFVILFLFLLISCESRFKNEKLYGFKVDTLLFGKINQLDTFNKKIYCYNYSDLPINIIKIEASCGCTKPRIIDSTINPMDSVPIIMEYIPKLSNDSGKINKYLTLRTNSSPAFVNLILKGEVIK